MRLRGLIPTITAGSDGLVLRTDDSGMGWQRLTEGGRDDLSDIFFLDGSRGWAVGARGKILMTRNGGKAWYPQLSGVTQHLDAVTFVDEKNGYRAFRRLLLRFGFGVHPGREARLLMAELEVI